MSVPAAMIVRPGPPPHDGARDVEVGGPIFVLGLDALDAIEGNFQVHGTVPIPFPSWVVIAVEGRSSVSSP
ncbi:hypothetical protein [Embleya sp. MST-111070]|uniref:hypothetical protein n=1 Tax=Embleya sp. MST-111070 TaxID=3398231 RepID=UPI003F737FF1